MTVSVRVSVRPSAVGRRGNERWGGWEGQWPTLLLFILASLCIRPTELLQKRRRRKRRSAGHFPSAHAKITKWKEKRERRHYFFQEWKVKMKSTLNVCATLFYWQEILMELLFFFIKLILSSRPPVFMTTNRVTPNSPRLLGWPCLLVSRFLYPSKGSNPTEKQFRFFFMLIVFYLPHFLC